MGLGAGFIFIRIFRSSSAQNDRPRLAKSFASQFAALAMITRCNATASWYGLQYRTGYQYGVCAGLSIRGSKMGHKLTTKGPMRIDRDEVFWGVCILISCGILIACLV